RSRPSTYRLSRTRASPRRWRRACRRPTRPDRRAASAGERRRTRRSRQREPRSLAPGSPTPQLLPGGFDLPVDGAGIDRVAIAGERPRPRGNRILDAASLEEDVAVMILDDRVGRELI